jgi:hypothetical protein
LMNETRVDNAVLAKVFAELVDVLRDLRNAVDPVGPIRPLSIAEAAKALRCRRGDVECLIENGTIPCIDRNGRRYILPSDIGALLRKESVRKSPTRRRRATKNQVDTGDIYPALREFFD